MQPKSVIACSFFEIISDANAYLDTFFWCAILLLCKHVYLLVLLLSPHQAKFLIEPFNLFSAVDMT